MNISSVIALKFLFSNKTQTLLMILGISIGVAAQVFVGLLIISLQADLLDTSLGAVSHVSASGEYEHLEPILEYSLDDERFLKKQITATINTIDENGDRLLLNGVTFDDNEITNISERVIKGSLPDKEEVILGSEYQTDFKIGDEIQVTSQDGINNYTISGFFDLGSDNLNNSLGYTKITTLEQDYEQDNLSYTFVSQLNDVYTSQAVATDLQAYDAQISEWQESNSDLLVGLNAQAISSNMIQIFIIMSLVLTIMSVLIVSAIQKSKQLGILKALGLSDGRSFKVYLVQGLTLGVIGALLGISLGLGLLWIFDNFVTTADGMPVIEIIFNYQFIIFSFVIVTVASTLASIIPALRIKRLTAQEVIAGE